MDGFNKSLDELLHFSDRMKLREIELEQKHNLELEKQKNEYELQIQIEKRRAEHVQEINRTLTERLERTTQHHVDLEQKYTVLLTKYNCTIEESKQIKDQHNEKRSRIEELDRIVQIFKNEKIKLENEVKQLKTNNQTLEDKIKEIPPPPQPAPTPTSPPPTQTVPDEVVQLIQKAITENQELKNLVTERENEIQKLNEQLNKLHIEDSQLIEQRLLHLVTKLKTDFRQMYENQANFFLQKIDLLKQEQRENIASLYKH